MLPALALALLVHGQAASGATRETISCSEPVTPFCVESDATFEDELSIRRCRSEVEDYIDGIKEYVGCLSQQQRETEAWGTSIQRQFDCKASGKAGCAKAD